MLKKLPSLATAWIAAHPLKALACAMTLCGAGVFGSSLLTPPSIVPQSAANFSQSQQLGTANTILKPNGGSSGAEEVPATVTNSFFYGVEGSVDPALNNYQYALGNGVAGTSLLLNGATSGAPTFITQHNFAWWLAVSPFTFGNSPGVSSSPANYLNGYFPWTFSGGGCTRAQSGVIGPTTGGTTSASLVDSGFQCNTTPSSVSMPTIPNIGAKQNATIASCTSSTPSGQAQVTVSVPISHGIYPGASALTMAGFTSPATAFNQTNYVATQGTTGTTLVLESPLGASGVCPGGVTYPVTGGTALSGTGGAVTVDASISTTNPFGTNEATGITTKPGEKFCAAIGEYGSDSPTPGFQFAAFSRADGTALTNSPAVSTWPNQGAVNFTGYTIVGAQSPSSPALTVTAMNSYAVTAASYSSGTKYATFTSSTNPNLYPGSEFTVSGATTSGGGTFNGSYIAVAGTSGTTIVGNPLAAPLGLPAATALTNSSTASTGSLVGVIVPGMQPFGAAGAILPFGTFGGTGTGGAGTYALGSNQVATGTATVTSVTAATLGSSTMTVTGSPTTPIAIGVSLTAASYTTTGPLVVTGYLTGTGGSGTYTVSNPNAGTVSASTSFGLAGTVGSPGSPVTIFANNAFYYTVAATASSNATIGVLTNKTQASISDFFNYFGGFNNLAQFTGWGGSLANIGMYAGIFPESANQPSQAALASTCQKTTDYQTFATANGLTVRSLYRLNDPGIWGDSSVAQFTGSISGTALSIVSTQSGSTTSLPVNTVIAGSGITGCPATCPTVSSGAGAFYVLNTSGGTVSSEAMTAGKYKPATPAAAQNGFNGYISGSNLTVTSVASANKAVFTATTAYPKNSFLGHIDNGITTGTTGNVLTVTTAPTAPFANTMQAGVQVCWSGAPTPCPYIISEGTGGGAAGTYFLDQNISGGVAASTSFAGTVLTPLAGESMTLQATQLVVSAITSGTVGFGDLVSDGAVNITGQPLSIIGQASGTTGGIGTYNLAPNYYAPIAAGETMDGVTTMLAPGQYVRDDVTHTVTTPVKIIGYGTGAAAPGYCATGEWGCGTYTILNPAGLTIGSSGSPVAFTANGATDGAAITPGPALTIKDLGPNVTFPVTNYGAGTGTLYLSGTYSTGSLGGNPTAIQAQVSYTAGGPPISGCTPCAWTTLTNDVTGGGNWSGQAISIPGGGPYFVSVRAANGTSYATLPSAVKVGLVFDLWGVGQSQPVVEPSNGGWGYSTYPGLWGVNTPFQGSFYYYDTGPSVSGSNLFPSYAQLIGGDQPGIGGGKGSNNLAEGQRDLGMNLQTAMGYPVTVTDWSRDGAGFGVFTWDGYTKSQTIGLGDGSSVTWCSASSFCANVGQGGTLDENLASLTGSQFTGSISGTTLTVGTLNTGALEPGLVLSDSFTGGGSHVSGSPTLVNCTSGCGALNGSGSVWTISASQGTVTLENMRADPVGGAPAPFYNPQASYAGGNFGQTIKAGTFSVSVNGSVVCTDSNVYPLYNVMAGNCTGAGISSSFVNYHTGDYQITFSSAPANNAVITASWVGISSPQPLNGSNVVHNLSYVGTGADHSGFLSSMYSRTPGGSSGHILAGCITDDTTMWETGYPIGAVGYSQDIDQFYGVTVPGLFTGSNGLAYMNAATPLISANNWRGDGLPAYVSVASEMSYNSACDQWAIDLATPSTFSGTIGSVSGSGPSTASLTLSGAATGAMWEGEVVGCTTFSLTCAVTPGTYITGLLTGTWGANGSTYGLANQTSTAIAAIGSATGMTNEVYYTAGQVIYAGAMNDSSVVGDGGGVNGSDGYFAHPSFGLASASRIARKWSADIYGGLTGNAARPTLDRVKAHAAGCDSGSIAGPCFDIGNTYAASHSGTIGGSTITVTGGLSANSRPFVPGQLITCSGCTSGRIIQSVSLPPTQSTATGAGQIGQTFTITASGTLGVSTTETVTAGCSGTSGTGSNCIDIAFSINTGGTYGTAASLATCGANNLNSGTPPYANPNGICSTNGVGSLVHNFRIGTQQAAWGGVTGGQTPSTGSPYDDGVDYNGTFNQSAAFTCNIVAAKVVQCVKGAAYSSGVVSGAGQWSTGSTFVEYGDTVVGTGRGNSLVGNVGGQPFAFTAGSGYTPGTYTLTASNCITTTGANKTIPQVDVTVGSGGGIIDVYGSTASDAIGQAVGNGCSFNLKSAITASITGAGGTAVLNVTGLTSGGLAHGQTLTGASVNAGTTLNACTAGCVGNPTVSGFIPTNSTAQTWSLTGYTGTAISSEAMTTAVASMGAGTGGAVGTINVPPLDGTYGIPHMNSGVLMGDELYDNSGLSGNPLNSFFDNGMGGYFEPGLPVMPFGLFLGAKVSG